MGWLQSHSRKMMPRRSYATFVEYAMLAGLVAVIVAVAVMVFGKNLKNVFSDTADKVEQVDTKVKGADLSK